jgi:class 3 adenylate cyclase
VQDCRIQARVAIHYGKCTGGVVGSSRPRYHLFGSAIEIVQVLEEEGSVDGVVLSRTAARVMGLNKNGVCDDEHLLSVLKNVDSRFLSGCCLVMENYR